MKTIGMQASLRDAMALINESPHKICVVTDADGVLVRTLTDGDIRRAMLDGRTIDESVTALGDNPPVSFSEDSEPATLLEALDAHGITSVVITDEHNRPVRLANRSTLRSQVLLSPPHIGARESSYVAQAFEDNWIAPAGPNLSAFEERLANLIGRQHCIAVSSGTAGIHLAIRALNLPPNASVYVSDLTFAASVQPVLYERLTPVLIDCAPDTWNMSPASLERALERDAARGTLPGAIVVVHLYGQSADMRRIMELADRFGVPVIEDAAESLGATYENRQSGAHGLISVFSFNGNKIITTSGGGAVLTDDPEIAETMRYLATQGRDSAEHYQHAHIAYNYRMSNVLAGIGLGQLEVLDERIAARRGIFQRYVEGLGDIPGVGFQAESPSGKGNRWLTVVGFDPDYVRVHPYQILRRLREAGIESRPGWKPMHMQPLCQGATFIPHSHDESVSAMHFLTHLCLPTGSSLSEADQVRIIDRMRHILMETTR